MHMVTLAARGLFPRCKRCGDQVRFTLTRIVKDGSAVPFRTTAILEEYSEPFESWQKAS